MKDFDGLIPSLYTFFEDFKYLESCVHGVKRLFGPSIKSVWETMRSMLIPFSDSEVEESVIETSESTFRRQRATDVERLDTGYLQVWLYAMRHYPLMPPDPKNDDDLLAKPARAKADERAIYEMAELARRLGFKSPEIDALIDSSPDHQIARAALLQARKPNRFRYDAQQFDILVSQIADCFTEAVPDPPDMVHGLLADSTVKPRARCRMPQRTVYMPMILGLLTQSLPFLSAVVSISPSLENLHELYPLTATKSESPRLFLHRHCLSERMARLVSMDPLCKRIYQRSRLGKNKKSHWSNRPDGMGNSKFWAASRR